MKLIAKPVKNQKTPVYDKYAFSAPQFFGFSFLGLALGLIICWLCYHSLYSLPLAAAAAWIYVNNKKKALILNRKKQLLYHFKDFLSSLHAALNAGYSLENGIAASETDLKRLYGENDVMVNELKLIVFGLRLKKPVEDLFYELGVRSGLEDILFFSELLLIGKRQGGNLGKILSDTKRIICEKIETEHEIDKQLAARKYEQKVMSLVPLCIIIYLRLTFDGFIEQLYGNFVGIIIMTVCLAVYILACHIGNKIVDIQI